jgi:hypothetical protein
VHPVSIIMGLSCRILHARSCGLVFSKPGGGVMIVFCGEEVAMD